MRIRDYYVPSSGDTRLKSLQNVEAEISELEANGQEAQVLIEDISKKVFRGRLTVALNSENIDWLRVQVSKKFSGPTKT